MVVENGKRGDEADSVRIRADLGGNGQVSLMSNCRFVASRDFLPVRESSISLNVLCSVVVKITFKFC